MERTEKKCFFRKFIGDKKFYLMVLSIAIPIMIQNGITNFVSLLDNIMIGRIGTERDVRRCDCESADFCIQSVYFRWCIRSRDFHSTIFWKRRSGGRTQHDAV